MMQLDLLSTRPLIQRKTAPYQAHSPTSHEAALAIQPRLGRLQETVYNALRAAPATDEQLQSLLRLSPSTQRPRRIELVEMGKVRDSGRKAKTISGRNAAVWEAV